MRCVSLDDSIVTSFSTIQPVNDSINLKNKVLFERFANATWKAGQPFRGLERISTKNFTLFKFLPPEEIENDWNQIKAAAEMLKKHL